MDQDHPVETGHDTIGSGNEGNERAEQRQRLFTIVLAVGVATLVIGGLTLFNSIVSPFKRAPNVNQADVEAQAIAALKSQDTDQDGLNDYDEIATYRTSVFVKDTDSDGQTDAEEIAAQTDPNCPEGRTCGLAALTNTNASGTRAAQLRESLRKGGVPSYLLDEANDETILQAYKQTLIGTNVNGDVSQVDLEKLTAGEIRKLLIANGLSEESLKSIDDATILNIYQDALAIDTTTP